MSNSRNIRRSVKRNVSAVSMAALGTVTVGGVLMATAGTAFAAAPTVSAANTTGSAATNVYPGMSGQAAGSVTITLSNQFAAGDIINVPIQVNQTFANGVETLAPAATVGSAPGPNDGTAAQAVSFTTKPTVTVSTNTTAQTTAGDTAPTVTAALATNPADSGAVKNAAVTDELVLTFGNNATGTSTDTYTITLSGVQYTLGASAGSTAGQVPAYLAPSYQPAGTAAPGTAATGSPVNNANIQNYQLTESPTGVNAAAPSAPVSDFTLKEVAPGTFPAGTGVYYTLKAGSGTFTGTATVTATGFTVAALTSAGACPTTGAASATVTVPTTSTGNALANTVQFCVLTGTGTSTTPGSLAISGLTYVPNGTPGTDTVTLSNSSTGTTWATGTAAIAKVSNPSVYGYSADDTAAAAANLAATSGNPAVTAANAVVLASDAEYQDALAASYLIHSNLQAQTNTGGTVTSQVNPLLLNPYDSTNEAATAAGQEIRKLGAGTVYVVGGTAAISTDVTNQLSKIQIGSTTAGAPVYLQVIRIAGATAEQTAAMVATYPSNGAPSPVATPGAYGMYNSGASESSTGPTAAVPTAIVADADEFQDALSASPLASGLKIPVLLTPGGGALDPNAASALINLGVKQVYVIGGSAAVSDGAVASLQAAGISVLRIAGTTFDATSNLLAQFEVNKYAAPVTGVTTAPQIGLGSGATAQGGETGPSLTVGTSRGDAYQDALSAAQYLGANGVVDPLLLNSGVSTISTGAQTFLTAHGQNSGFVIYTSPTTTNGSPLAESVKQDTVFGGALAQTPALVQSELNSIAGA